MPGILDVQSKGYFASISEFKFLHDIGVGSFGKVKLALHRGTSKYYAIKIIDLSYLSQKELNLLSREITVHSKLDHPHIIKLWDTISSSNTMYLVMDYASNGSLFNYQSRLLMKGQQSSSTQVYKFFYQTLQAVKYLHSIDIMHRDIKPQNLLLDDNLNVKLCDFGWATNQIKCPRVTFCGTYEYMAPEMVLEQSYDYRIDIWALGVLIFQLVHGKAPFRAAQLSGMKQKISKGSYEIDSHCSQSQKDLIVDILQFLPEKRLTIQEIEGHVWVKSCQKQCTREAIVQQEELLHSMKAKLSNEKYVIVPQKSLKRHQNQKSMGDFLIGHSRNYLIDSPNETKYYINSQELEEDCKPELCPKKHRRNITQPIIGDFQRQEAEKNYQEAISNHKLKMKLQNLRTDTNTPNQVTSYHQMELMKPQGESSQERNHEDDSSQLRHQKKKKHMRSDSGPIEAGNGHRNLSNGLECGEKGRKKGKGSQKHSSKMRSIEQKLLEISGKIGLDKYRFQKIKLG